MLSSIGDVEAVSAEINILSEMEDVLPLPEAASDMAQQSTADNRLSVPLKKSKSFNSGPRMLPPTPSDLYSSPKDSVARSPTSDASNTLAVDVESVSSS